MRNWTADVEVDAALAHFLVCECWPEFAGPLPLFAGQGWDNKCFLYEEPQIVFRFPTRQMGADLVGPERAALPVVAEHVELAVPTPMFIGEPSASFPFPFTGFRFISGVTADSVPWNEDMSRVAAPPLGAFLRQLHGIDLADDRLERVPLDIWGKTTPEVLATKIKPRPGQILSFRPDLKSFIDHCLTAFDRVAGTCEPDWTTPNVLVHGDLYPRHIVVDFGPQDWEVKGVIDWGDAHIGSAASDLSLGWTLFDYRTRPLFWEAYGQVPSEEMAKRARLRAAMYGFSLLAYGLDVDDRPAAGLGFRALQNVLLEG